jgi:hypothetical protein
LTLHQLFLLKRQETSKRRPLSSLKRRAADFRTLMRMVTGWASDQALSVPIWLLKRAQLRSRSPLAKRPLSSRLHPLMCPKLKRKKLQSLKWQHLRKLKVTLEP